jgi:hypothetical protein
MHDGQVTARLEEERRRREESDDLMRAPEASLFDEEGAFAFGCVRCSSPCSHSSLRPVELKRTPYFVLDNPDEPFPTEDETRE